MHWFEPVNDITLFYFFFFSHQHIVSSFFPVHLPVFTFWSAHLQHRSWTLRQIWGLLSSPCGSSHSWLSTSSHLSQGLEHQIMTISKFLHNKRNSFELHIPATWSDLTSTQVRFTSIKTEHIHSKITCRVNVNRLISVCDWTNIYLFQGRIHFWMPVLCRMFDPIRGRSHSLSQTPLHVSTKGNWMWLFDLSQQFMPYDLICTQVFRSSIRINWI